MRKSGRLPCRSLAGRLRRMAMGAEMAEEVGADILDVNCGCPAPKVVKNGGGSGLLRDLPRLEEILKEIKKADHDPADPKAADRLFRIDDQRRRGRQNGRAMRRRAYSGSRPHARTGLQRPCKLGPDQAGKRGGKRACFGQRRYHDDRIRHERWRETGTDGILIGRGAMQNPWIFRQFARRSRGPRTISAGSARKERRCCSSFFECAAKRCPRSSRLAR